jgi:hypothetical protein
VQGTAISTFIFCPATCNTLEFAKLYFSSSVVLPVSNWSLVLIITSICYLLPLTQILTAAKCGTVLSAITC